MKKLFLLFILTIFFAVSSSYGQIFNPEGLNIPGSYDGFSNPPTVLALASATQAGGDVSVITVGTRRYHTKFNAEAAGGDVVGGNYTFLFTSGSNGNEFDNKWANVNVVMNTLQTYTKEGSTDNSISLVNGNWYTVNWQDQGYVDTEAIFMETSAEPVDITAVSGVYTADGSPLPITITLSNTKSPEENIYVRYTTDGFATSQFLLANCIGNSCTVTIPGGDVMNDANHQLYILSTTLSTPTLASANADMLTINLNNNVGANYQMGVGALLPVELTTFSGKVTKAGNALNWSTASELNNSHFEIQRSKAGKSWQAIGKVQGAGTTLEAQTYTFVDDNPLPGANYYRLKQMDVDGTFAYSDAIQLIAKTATVQIFPNPVTEVLNYQFTDVQEVERVQLFDVNGKLVRETTAVTGQLSMTDLPKGVYLFVLETAGERVQQRIVKQ